MALVQGRAQKLGGNINERNNPFVGHTGRADDAQHADASAVGLVGGGYHAAVAK